MNGAKLIQHYREAEREALAKMERVAQRHMRADPRMSHAVAFAQAVNELPRTYRRYSQARDFLASARLRPLTTEEL